MFINFIVFSLILSLPNARPTRVSFEPMDLSNSKIQEFISALRVNYSIVAQPMGYVLPSAGLTCEELLIDFEELLSGEALKLSLQQLTQQVNRLNQNFLRTIREQTRILSETFQELLERELGALQEGGARPKRNPVVIALGIFAAYKALDSSIELYKAYFRSRSNDILLEAFTEISSETNAIIGRAVIETKLELLVSDQKTKIFERGSQVLYDLFSDHRVSPHLFNNESEIRNATSKILGDNYKGSLFEVYPASAVRLLTAVPRGTDGNKTITEICAPIVHLQRRRLLFKVQHLGEFSADKTYFSIPLVPEYVAVDENEITKNLDKPEALVVDISNCVHVGRNTVCNQLRKPAVGCGLYSQESCLFETQYANKEFTFFRRMGDMGLIATKETNIEVSFSGFDYNIKVTEPIFAIPMPDGCILKVGTKILYGTGRDKLTTKISLLFGKVDNIISSVEIAIEGMTNPKFDAHVRRVSRAENGLYAAESAILLALLGLIGAFVFIKRGGTRSETISRDLSAVKTKAKSKFKECKKSLMACTIKLGIPPPNMSESEMSDTNSICSGRSVKFV